MNSDVEKFWIDYSNEGTEKFEKSMTNITNSQRTFWTSLMTIQAALLGISMAFTQYLETPANGFLIATWILLILSIGCGIIIFKCSLDGELRDSLSRFKFSMDMSEFNLRNTRKEFKSEEEREGMFLAALMKFEKFTEVLTPYAKGLVEKYKSQLPSEKYFTDIKYSKLIAIYKKTIKKLDDNINVIMTIFYLLTFGAFVSLLISILVRTRA